METGPALFVCLSSLPEEQPFFDGVRAYVRQHRLPWDLVPAIHGKCFPYLDRLVQARDTDVLIGRLGKEPYLLAARARGLRWVEWVADLDRATGEAQIGIDDASLASQAVDHLMSLGMQRFAVIGPLTGHVPHRDRRHRAFIDELARRGHDCAVVRRQVSEPWEDDLVALIRRVPGGLGIFVYHDDMALHAMPHLLKRDLRIPGELAILGCGDTRLGQVSTPTLSSVRLPHFGLGQAAARQAHQLLSGNRPEPVLLPGAGIAERATTLGGKEAGDPLLARVLARVRRKDRPLPDVAELAQHCRLDRRRLHERCVYLLGRPPKTWLMERAMQRAAALLVDTDLPLSAIARRCGLTQKTHLIARFRQRFGLPPDRFRRQTREGKVER